MVKNVCQSADKTLGIGLHLFLVGSLVSFITFELNLGSKWKFWLRCASQQENIAKTRPFFQPKDQQ